VGAKIKLVKSHGITVGFKRAWRSGRKQKMKGRERGAIYDRGPQQRGRGGGGRIGPKVSKREKRAQRGKRKRKHGLSPGIGGRGNESV